MAAAPPYCGPLKKATMKADPAKRSAPASRFQVDAR